MKKVAFFIVLAGLSLSVSLLVLEYGLRLFYFRPWAEANIVGNPDHRMTKQYNNNVNSDGIRSPVEADSFHDKDFNVLFLGDSFTYGWRVKAGKTLPTQFERQGHAAGHISLKSVNFGWVSSSPYLSNRLLREKGAKYKPDLVILILDMTDIFDDRLYRNIAEKKYFFRYGQYLPAITQFISAINQGIWQSEWLAQGLFGVPAHRFFFVEQPLELTRPYFDELMANVDEIHAYCRDVLHIPFVVFVMPRHFQFDPRLSPDNWEKAQYPLSGPYLLEPFRYFDHIATQKPYPVISLLEDFRRADVFPMTFSDDPHLNEHGNAFAARTLLERLAEIGLSLN